MSPRQVGTDESLVVLTFVRAQDLKAALLLQVLPEKASVNDALRWECPWKGFIKSGKSWRYRWRKSDSDWVIESFETSIQDRKRAHLRGRKERILSSPPFPRDAFAISVRLGQRCDCDS